MWGERTSRPTDPHLYPHFNPQIHHHFNPNSSRVTIVLTLVRATARTSLTHTCIHTCIHTFTQGYKRITTFKGHSSYITHLDWSADSRILQSNCGAYELLYSEAATGKQVGRQQGGEGGRGGGGEEENPVGRSHPPGAPR